MSETNPLTDYRLKTVEEAVRSIDENLMKLTSLEQKHLETREALARAFNAIEAQDGRIKAVELEMPMLKLTRSWILGAVLGVFMLVGTAVISALVISKSVPAPATTAVINPR